MFDFLKKKKKIIKNKEITDIEEETEEIEIITNKKENYKNNNYEQNVKFICNLNISEINNEIINNIVIDIINRNDKETVKCLINKIKKHIPSTANIKYIENYENFSNKHFVFIDEKLIDDSFDNNINKYFKIENESEIGIVCINPFVYCEQNNWKNDIKYFINRIVVPPEIFTEIINDNFQRISNKNLQIVDSITQILENAIKKDATDIFLELKGDDVELNFRIDGIINLQSYPLNKVEFKSIERAIKEDAGFNSNIMAKEIKGKIKKVIFNQKKEFRLSIMPLTNGTAINIRILATIDKSKTLEAFGYYKKDIDIINNILSQNQGLFLVIGETGSGKTTTINTALLQKYYINKRKNQTLKITTIEDPVEIEIKPEFSQTDLKTEGDEKFVETWADKIKVLLRQNPNIVLVGETRDLETVEAVANIAGSGHLILSTFHSFSGRAAINRIENLNYNVSKFNQLLLGTLSQNLVPVLCKCKVPDVYGTKEFKEKNNITEEIQLYKRNPDGCSLCKKRPIKGINGKTVIYELIEFSQQYIGNYKENFNDAVVNMTTKKEIIKQKLLDGVIDLGVYNDFLNSNKN